MGVLERLARENGAASEPGWVPLLRGWVEAHDGRAKGGFARFRRGMSAHYGASNWPNRLCQLTMLAEVCRHAKHLEQGLAALAEAEDGLKKTDLRWFEPQLHQMKGDLLLACGRGKRHAEAEASFHTAIQVARHQGAKSWELRAALGLSRLWQQEGKAAEARDLLGVLYNSFTEGFDTPDLQDAKDMLAELAHA